MLFLNNRFVIALSTLMLLLTTWQLAPVQAQTDTRVFLQPIASTESTVTVDVVAENVADLYGVELWLRYDPAAVSVRDTQPEQEGLQINAGNLLPTEQGFVVANQANQNNGTIVFAMTLLNPAPPVSGSGPLAQITFDLLQNSTTEIEITDLKLVAVNLQVIPAETTPLTIEASSSPAAAAPESSAFPWWIVAGGIMVLGLITLGVFVVIGSAKPSSPQPARPVKPAAQPQQPQAMPTDQQQPPATSRPSAFKKSYR